MFMSYHGLKLPTIVMRNLKLTDYIIFINVIRAFTIEMNDDILEWYAFTVSLINWLLTHLNYFLLTIKHGLLRPHSFIIKVISASFSLFIIDKQFLHSLLQEI